MLDYLKSNDISIKDDADVNSIMHDMMSILLEGVLDEELDYPDMITRTQKQIKVEMNILAKSCTPIMETSMQLFQDTVKVTMSHS